MENEQKELLEKLFDNRKKLVELKKDKKSISDDIKHLEDEDEKLLRLIKESMSGQ